ncbi:MAG: carboxypeptidase regulatory-like domain-containing protein [Candidatus Aenigmarchaeota archaeon]|nr:carboxypeptidase regulatory-like domain-containing protein [Candidatus Aenigmarchaeota archaeon]
MDLPETESSILLRMLDKYKLFDIDIELAQFFRISNRGDIEGPYKGLPEPYRMGGTGRNIPLEHFRITTVRFRSREGVPYIYFRTPRIEAGSVKIGKINVLDRPLKINDLVWITPQDGRVGLVIGTIIRIIDTERTKKPPKEDENEELEKIKEELEENRRLYALPSGEKPALKPYAPGPLPANIPRRGRKERGLWEDNRPIPMGPLRPPALPPGREGRPEPRPVILEEGIREPTIVNIYALPLDERGRPGLHGVQQLRARILTSEPRRLELIDQLLPLRNLELDNPPARILIEAEYDHPQAGRLVAHREFDLHPGVNNLILQFRIPFGAGGIGGPGRPEGPVGGGPARPEGVGGGEGEGWWFEGHVVDQNNNPIPNARITIAGTAHSVATGANGRYRIPAAGGLPQGNYTLFCQVPPEQTRGAAQTHAADVNIAEGGQAEIRIFPVEVEHRQNRGGEPRREG